MIPHITAKQGPGTFLLHIRKAKLSDAGLYYCLNVNLFDLTFLNGTFLRIGGPEPNITFITEDFPSDPARPGDSVTLRCSVFSDPERRTCPGEPSVFWFKAGSDESHPSLIYAQRSNSAACEKSPEAHSPQKCVYSVSKNVSSSDAGTHYCAVATCGQILFGNGTKLNNKAPDTVQILLLSTLAISLIVNAFMIYTFKIKTCHCYNASGDPQAQRRNEDLVEYSAPTFTKRKTGRAERKNVKPAEEETVYADVRTLVMD
ncbi:uncharacterized protein LOC130209323 [Pseudoliparis swirei]|uniref:uncharacterized protein LOC130209323 n=1 Tax=Pseudoliparis swirei TaxID=2059687 RepID=UPI0024BEAE75|nr:uncharacterized protein LOC130209323 [Pseudoliparis swirei]